MPQPALLLLFLLLHLPTTHTTLIQLYPQEHPSRHTTLSTTSPLTHTLSQNPHPTTVLHTLINTLSKTIDNRITTNHTLACNLRVAPWITLQQTDLQHRQIGTLSQACRTNLLASQAVHTTELPSNFLQNARSTLFHATLAHAAAGDAFVKYHNSVQWNNVYPVRGWDVVKGSQTCSLETNTAYRVQGIWYIRAVITNHPVDAFVPDWQREYVEEFVKSDFGDALYTVQPGIHEALVNGTTLLTRRGGKAGFSTVPMAEGDNPALEEALRRNELAVDQAIDAVTLSNIAILALPMVMCLIPAAFVAELNTFATLLYTAFTDIFSALPFLIKGVELTNVGVIKRGELVAYHIGNETLGVMEVWSAECHGKDSFRSLGIAFTVVAVVVMAFGVALEWFAWKWMKRKGRVGNGPFGDVFRAGPYTAFETTVDEFDDAIVFNDNCRRWRIRLKRWKMDQHFHDRDHDVARSS